MPRQETRTRPRIVAAVDGSPASLNALRWAIRQARLVQARIVAGSPAQVLLDASEGPNSW